MKRLIPWLKRSGNSKRRFPVRFVLALASSALLAGATLITGCASQKAAQRVQQKEAVLQQCGFKAVPVTTPQQQQQIIMLQPDKISVVQRKGTRYYVFPDPSRQMLYVGRDQQYSLYESYLSNQAENAQYNAISKGDPAVAQYNNEAELLGGSASAVGWDDDSWGAWDSN